jgi:hypothetical protein
MNARDDNAPADAGTRPRGTFLGIPYELGPVVGHFGAYAIVGWIKWNGAMYAYDGLTGEKTEKVSASLRELIVPPGMRYTRSGT